MDLTKFLRDSLRSRYHNSQQKTAPKDAEEYIKQLKNAHISWLAVVTALLEPQTAEYTYTRLYEQAGGFCLHVCSRIIDAQGGKLYPAQASVLRWVFADDERLPVSIEQFIRKPAILGTQFDISRYYCGSFWGAFLRMAATSDKGDILLKETGQCFSEAAIAFASLGNKDAQLSVAIYKRFIDGLFKHYEAYKTCYRAPIDFSSKYHFLEHLYDMNKIISALEQNSKKTEGLWEVYGHFIVGLLHYLVDACNCSKLVKCQLLEFFMRQCCLQYPLSGEELIDCFEAEENPQKNQIQDITYSKEGQPGNFWVMLYAVCDELRQACTPQEIFNKTISFMIGVEREIRDIYDDADYEEVTTGFMMVTVNSLKSCKQTNQEPLTTEGE